MKKKRFRLSKEQTLRLKKALQSLKNLLILDSPSRLSLSLTRYRLKDLAKSIPERHRVRKGIYRILELTGECPVSPASRGRCLMLLAELHVACRFDRMQFRPSQMLSGCR